MDAVEFTLLPAPDESPLMEAYEVAKLTLVPDESPDPENLLRYHPRISFYAGGGLATTSLFTSLLTAAAALGPALGAVLGAWLHAHYGRKVRLKIGEIEAEAQTPEEVQKLIDQAVGIQKRNAPKIIQDP